MSFRGNFALLGGANLLELSVSTSKIKLPTKPGCNSPPKRVSEKLSQWGKEGTRRQADVPRKLLVVVCQRILIRILMGARHYRGLTAPGKQLMSRLPVPFLSRALRDSTVPFHKICRWWCGERSKGFENDSHNLKMMLKREELNIHKVREIKAY